MEIDTSKSIPQFKSPKKNKQRKYAEKAGGGESNVQDIGVTVVEDLSGGLSSAKEEKKKKRRAKAANEENDPTSTALSGGTEEKEKKKKRKEKDASALVSATSQTIFFVTLIFMSR